MVDPITQAARHRRGLPTGRFSSRTLAFDIETQTLVLGVQEHRVGAVEELYIRTIHEEQYTNVCQLFDALVKLGAESRLVISSWAIGGGMIFCAIAIAERTFATPSSAPQIHALESRGLARLELRGREVTTWPIIDEATSVVELLAADGDRLYATVGRRSVHSRGPVEYALVEMEWNGRLVRQLSPMPDKFF